MVSIQVCTNECVSYRCKYYEETTRYTLVSLSVISFHPKSRLTSNIIPHTLRPKLHGKCVLSLSKMPTYMYNL